MRILWIRLCKQCQAQTDFHTALSEKNLIMQLSSSDFNNCVLLKLSQGQVSWTQGHNGIVSTETEGSRQFVCKLTEHVVHFDSQYA